MQRIKDTVIRYTTQSATIMHAPDQNDAVKYMIAPARTCYQSQNQASELKDMILLNSIMKRKHLSILEHVSATLKIVTNRAIANELTRHRMASFAQESTRYVAYKGPVTYIKSSWMDDEIDDLLEAITLVYQDTLKTNPPQFARDILPLCLATELVVTANLREWIHILSLRTHHTAHPQMIELAKMIQSQLETIWPDIMAIVKENNLYAH